MTKISEIAKKLSEWITNAETRKRSRIAKEYQHFMYTIGYKKLFANISVDEIINVDSDCSQWRNRDDMWVSVKWKEYFH